MKRKNVIYSLSIFLFVSACSHLDFEQIALYTAENNGKFRCDPMMLLKKDYSGLKKYNTNETLRKFEESSGYSECSSRFEDDDTVYTECKKPMIYKSITTTKRAFCHKFMVDNKLVLDGSMLQKD
jgi:uncharacterized protein YfaT (DUF1175 family)